MHLLTLSDLKPTQSNEPVSLVPAYIQAHLQLLIKQMLLGLPVEPILKNYPQFQQWVRELEELSPTLFMPAKKLLIDISIPAKLELNCPSNGSGYNALSTYKFPLTTPPFKIIEICTNVGIVRGKIRLFEWAIRHPVLSWQDRVKLWVATESFNLRPDELQLIVLALHPTQTAQKVAFSWNRKQHKQTRNWLIATITKQTTQPFQPSIAIRKNATATDAPAAQPDDTAIAIALAKTVDEIDEVPL